MSASLESIKTEYNNLITAIQSSNGDNLDDLANQMDALTARRNAVWSALYPKFTAFIAATKEHATTAERNATLINEKTAAIEATRHQLRSVNSSGETDKKRIKMAIYKSHQLLDRLTLQYYICCGLCFALVLFYLNPNSEMNLFIICSVIVIIIIYYGYLMYIKHMNRDASEWHRRVIVYKGAESTGGVANSSIAAKALP